MAKILTSTSATAIQTVVPSGATHITEISLTINVVFYIINKFNHQPKYPQSD